MSHSTGNLANFDSNENFDHIHDGKVRSKAHSSYHDVEYNYRIENDRNGPYMVLKYRQKVESRWTEDLYNIHFTKSADGSNLLDEGKLTPQSKKELAKKVSHIVKTIISSQGAFEGASINNGKVLSCNGKEFPQGLKDATPLHWSSKKKTVSEKINKISSDIGEIFNSPTQTAARNTTLLPKRTASKKGSAPSIPHSSFPGDSDSTATSTPLVTKRTASKKSSVPHLPNAFVPNGGKKDGTEPSEFLAPPFTDPSPSGLSKTTPQRIPISGRGPQNVDEDLECGHPKRSERKEPVDPAGLEKSLLPLRREIDTVKERIAVLEENGSDDPVVLEEMQKTLEGLVQKLQRLEEAQRESSTSLQSREEDLRREHQEGLSHWKEQLQKEVQAINERITAVVETIPEKDEDPEPLARELQGLLQEVSEKLQALEGDSSPLKRQEQQLLELQETVGVLQNKAATYEKNVAEIRQFYEGKEDKQRQDILQAANDLKSRFREKVSRIRSLNIFDKIESFLNGHEEALKCLGMLSAKPDDLLNKIAADVEALLLRCQSEEDFQSVSCLKDLLRSSEDVDKLEDDVSLLMDWVSLIETVDQTVKNYQDACHDDKNFKAEDRYALDKLTGFKNALLNPWFSEKQMGKYSALPPRVKLYRSLMVGTRQFQKIQAEIHDLVFRKYDGLLQKRTQAHLKEIAAALKKTEAAAERIGEYRDAAIARMDELGQRVLEDAENHKGDQSCPSEIPDPKNQDLTEIREQVDGLFEALPDMARDIDAGIDDKLNIERERCRKLEEQVAHLQDALRKLSLRWALPENRAPLQRSQSQEHVPSPLQSSHPAPDFRDDMALDGLHTTPSSPGSTSEKAFLPDGRVSRKNRDLEEQVNKLEKEVQRLSRSRPAYTSENLLRGPENPGIVRPSSSNSSSSDTELESADDLSPAQSAPVSTFPKRTSRKTTFVLDKPKRETMFYHKGSVSSHGGPTHLSLAPDLGDFEIDSSLGEREQELAIQLDGIMQTYCDDFPLHSLPPGFAEKSRTLAVRLCELIEKTRSDTLYSHFLDQAQMGHNLSELQSSFDDKIKVLEDYKSDLQKVEGLSPQIPELFDRLKKNWENSAKKLESVKTFAESWTKAYHESENKAAYAKEKNLRIAEVVTALASGEQEERESVGKHFADLASKLCQAYLYQNLSPHPQDKVEAPQFAVDLDVWKSGKNMSKMDFLQNKHLITGVRFIRSLLTKSISPEEKHHLAEYHYRQLQAESYDHDNNKALPPLKQLLSWVEEDLQHPISLVMEDVEQTRQLKKLKAGEQSRNCRELDKIRAAKAQIPEEDITLENLSKEIRSLTDKDIFKRHGLVGKLLGSAPITKSPKSQSITLESGGQLWKMKRNDISGKVSVEHRGKKYVLHPEAWLMGKCSIDTVPMKDDQGTLYTLTRNRESQLLQVDHIEPELITSQIEIPALKSLEKEFISELPFGDEDIFLNPEDEQFPEAMTARLQGYDQALQHLSKFEKGRHYSETSWKARLNHRMSRLHKLSFLRQQSCLSKIQAQHPEIDKLLPMMHKSFAEGKDFEQCQKYLEYFQSEYEQRFYRRILQMLENDCPIRELTKELGKFNKVKPLMDKESSSEIPRRHDLEVSFQEEASPKEAQHAQSVRMMWMYQAITGKTLDEEQVDVIQECIEKSEKNPNYTCAMRTGFGKTELQLLFAAKDLCEGQEQGLCFSTNENNLLALKDRATPLAVRMGKEPIELRLNESDPQEAFLQLENPQDKIFFLSNDDLVIAKLRSEGESQQDLWRIIYQKLCKMKHSIDEVVAQTEGTPTEDMQLNAKITKMGFVCNIHEIPKLRYEVYSSLQGGKISFSATASELQGRTWNQDGSDELHSMKVDSLSYGRVVWTLSRATHVQIPPDPYEEDVLISQITEQAGEDLKTVLDVGINPLFNPREERFKDSSSYNEEKMRLAKKFYRRGSDRELRTQLKTGNGNLVDYYYDGAWHIVPEENKGDIDITRYISIDEAVGSDFIELNNSSGQVALILRGGIPPTSDLIQAMGRMRKMLEGQKCLCFSEMKPEEALQTTIALMQDADKQERDAYPEKLTEVLVRDVPNAFSKMIGLVRNRIEFIDDSPEDEGVENLLITIDQMKALREAWDKKKSNAAAGDFRDKFRGAVDKRIVPGDLLEKVMDCLKAKSESDIGEYFSTSLYDVNDILLKAKLRNLSNEIKRQTSPQNGIDPKEEFLIKFRLALSAGEGKAFKKYLEWLSKEMREHSINITQEQLQLWEMQLMKELLKIRFPTKTGLGRPLEEAHAASIATQLLNSFVAFPKVESELAA